MTDEDYSLKDGSSMSYSSHTNTNSSVTSTGLIISNLSITFSSDSSLTDSTYVSSVSFKDYSNLSQAFEISKLPSSFKLESSCSNSSQISYTSSFSPPPPAWLYSSNQNSTFTLTFQPLLINFGDQNYLNFSSNLTSSVQNFKNNRSVEVIVY